MPASNNPIVWDFYKKIGVANSPSGVVQYYNQQYQDLYSKDGSLSTMVGKVTEGDWEGSQLGDETTVDSSIQGPVRFDHPCSGTLYGVTITNGSLQYLRYVYSSDISRIVKSGSISSKVDNPIEQTQLQVMNISEVLFNSVNTLYQPGGRLELNLNVADSYHYKMGTSFIDSVDHSVTGSYVSISARNSVALLKDSTFDDVTEITGTAKEVAIRILEMAGIKSYIVGPSDHTWTHKFNPEQTLFEGLEQLFRFYEGWEMKELPDGTIVIGYPYFTVLYYANGKYTLSIGSELFSKRTKKSNDAVYSRVMVTGKDSEGNELSPVIVPIKHYAFWSIPANKTYHDTAPDGFTQEELQQYSETLAKSLQYVGIGNDFTSPIRPQLLVGDVIDVINGNEKVVLGIVTSIKHKFGLNGFYTDFSIDSGGEITDGENESVIVTNRPLGGYNRKQTLKDIIKEVK